MKHFCAPYSQDDAKYMLLLAIWNARLYFAATKMLSIEAQLQSNSNFQAEARILHRYLTGADPSAKAVELYCRYREATPWRPDPKEAKAWQMSQRNLFMLGCFDAYLALVHPSSAFRQPVYAMLAIAESLPEHADKFLPKNYRLADWFAVMRAGIGAAMKAAIGGIRWNLL